MPSLDPVRFVESAEDCALREELRELLGVPASNFFGVEPTAQLIALAEDLRREAARRRRTARHRPAWMLLAAGLPLALVFAGIGTWGVQQKHRADALAAAMAQKEVEIQLQRATAARERQSQNLQLASTATEKQPQKSSKPGTRPAELVIPAPDPSLLPPQAQTDQVKSH